MALQVILPPHIWVPQETVRGAVPLHLHAGQDLDFWPRWTGLQITHKGVREPSNQKALSFLALHQKLGWFGDPGIDACSRETRNE